MYLTVVLYSLILWEASKTTLEFHGSTKRFFKDLFGTWIQSKIFVDSLLAVWGAIILYMFVSGAAWHFKDQNGVFILCYAIAFPMLFTYCLNIAGMSYANLENV